MFGIGPSEILFILLLLLIIFGPKEMQKFARDLGRWMNRFVKSNTWRSMRTVGNEISNLPTRLMREAEREIWENDPALREQTLRPKSSVSFDDLRPSSPPSPSKTSQASSKGGEISPTAAEKTSNE